jgi:hypothetical protein
MAGYLMRPPSISEKERIVEERMKAVTSHDRRGEFMGNGVDGFGKMGCGWREGKWERSVELTGWGD